MDLPPRSSSLKFSPEESLGLGQGSASTPLRKLKTMLPDMFVVVKMAQEPVPFDQSVFSTP